MKKLTAVLAAMLLIACLFAACGGTENGKVTDTTNNDIPVITTDNTSDGMIDDMTDGFEDGKVSDTTNNSVTMSDTTSVTM